MLALSGENGVNQVLIDGWAVGRRLGLGGCRPFGGHVVPWTFGSFVNDPGPQRLGASTRATIVVPLAGAPEGCPILGALLCLGLLACSLEIPDLPCCGAE